MSRLQQLAARQPNAPPRALPLNDVLMEALDLVRPELTTSAERKAVRVDARLGEVKPVLAQPSELRELVSHAHPRGARGDGRRRRAVGDDAAGARRRGAGDDAPGGWPTAASDPFAGASERGVTLAAARDRARRWGGDLVVESRGGRLTLR